MLFAFTAKAQDISFDETVKYINDKMKCCAVNPNITISISMNTSGLLTVYTDGNKLTSLNVFELYNSSEFRFKNDDFKVKFESKGIVVGVIPAASHIYLLKSEENRLRLNSFSNIFDTERVYKALLHLRTLCTKETDPFDN